MRKFEWTLMLLLGATLGFGVATYRNFVPGQVAVAQEKGPAKDGGGIFSPPGTSDTGPVTPQPGEPPFKGKIGRTTASRRPTGAFAARSQGAPNVVFIVLDDVGFAALGCYGSPVCKTPNLDKLAKNGLRYNNFHTTALCSPSRSCFLTGRNHHTNAMGCITEGSTGFPGYNGRVPLSNGLLSEMLTPFGWSAFAVGKWHLTPNEDMNLAANRKWWPLGRGFDRFYGFLGGETDQWYPWLTYDNHFVKPPKTPKEGYHNVPDLTSKAKEFIADVKQVAPERPYFLYFCPGTAHAPHHVPEEWIAKYKGKFDAGWDDYREKALAKQIELGICPAGTKLSPRDPDVPEWAKLNAQEKELYAHEMEVYAAYLEYVDHYIGELVGFLGEVGDLENTVIITVSDNGASPEGARTARSTRTCSSTTRRRRSSRTSSTSRIGAGRAPIRTTRGVGLMPPTRRFRRWKREVARGGISDLCIVHWPKGFKARGEIRHQFTHAIDLVPTVLDLLKIKMPASINGVAQTPIEGVSFAPTFDDAKVKIPREAQYFEMLGTRSIYLDGWRAYAPWEKLGTQITPKDVDNAKWMLFNINEDFSESEDIAAKHPDKLTQLKQLWFMQASKYKVLPLDATSVERLALPRPQMSGPRRSTFTIKARARWSRPTRATSAIAPSVSTPTWRSLRRAPRAS